MSNFVNTVDIIGDEALSNGIIEKSLTEIVDNLVTNILTNKFASCAALTKVRFESVTRINDRAFQSCSALTTADFPAATYIGLWSLGQTALTTLILRSQTVATLYTNGIGLTPIASSTGYIYVPRALVDSYKAATNWSTYANQFRALEDYTVDGTTTGALDESKI